MDLRTCKWCYGIFLIEDKSKHSQCNRKRERHLARIKKGIKYDKTGGQKNDRTSTGI